MPQYIDPSARIDVPFRFLQGAILSTDKKKKGKTLFPSDYYIGPFVSIGQNNNLGNNIIIDAYCKIGSGVNIGDDCLITYRATIASKITIGSNCIVGGNVAEGVTIGDNCRTFGKLIHKHTDSTTSWDFHAIPEAGVTLHHDSFVAHGAQLIGGISIGPFSYVCAGATITKDVPPYHIAYGINKIIHHSKWNGNLKNNPLFKMNI